MQYAKEMRAESAKTATRNENSPRRARNHYTTHGAEARGKEAACMAFAAACGAIAALVLLGVM